MKILLTGAFGNIGQHTLHALLARGHQVRGFDLDTPANRRAARRWQGRAEFVWGDLRSPAQVNAAVAGVDAVIHLAFVIPHLSVTGKNCEDCPEWAEEINVGGTRNLLQAIQQQPTPPRLLFSSSLHVYGPTQHLPPPRRVEDAPQPVEHYARHKIACEEMIRASGLTWAILRLPATLPVRLILDPGMFNVPLDNRIEYGHGADVAAAFANALECPQVWGKTLLIGGGPRCQFYYRDLVSRILKATGLGMFPAAAFASQPFSTDWLDTTESQRLLRYQQRGLEDYLHDLKRALGWRLPFIRLLRRPIQAALLRRSPYFSAG